jgi:outer membrane protein OmpA-like peptidoglycan-associated protein
MISVSKFSKIVAGIAALAVAAATFTAVPALAAAPATPSFTVTNDVTHLALTNFVATQGVPVDETYTVDFNDAGWVFGTPGSGYGFSVGGFYNNGQNIGINAALTLSNDKKTFSLHLSGTPTTGWYQTGTVYLQDDNYLQYTYKFNVEVAGTTPTPHISVDGTPHTFGDVTNFLTSGLFASMPQLYLDRKDNSPLIPITNPNDVNSSTQVLNGTTTISYTSDPLYNDPTYGNVRASVVITLNDGVASYSVTTWSETYEGQTIAAGDVLLKSALVRGIDAATTDLTGGARSVFYIGSPYAVFESQSNSLDTATGIETGTSVSSDLEHTFKISFYDYSGCPIISELDTAKVAATLPVTGYVSNASCAAYLPVFNFTDFGNKTVGDTVAWDASAKYGPYTYTVDSGTLPDGLTLNASTGAITGTATTAGEYSFSIKASKTLASGIQGYFGTINTVPGPAPVLTFSSHTLPAGGSVNLNVSGDPTGYGVCAFISETAVGCFPISLSEDMSAPLDWASGYGIFGAVTVTFRLYKISDIANPETGVPWNTPFASGDYFEIAPPNVPDAVVDLTATSSAYSSANLDWTVPNDGYSPITSYLVYQDDVLIATIDSTSPEWPQNGATTISYQVAGLTKLTTYNFKVVAVNVMGNSADATDPATTPDKTFSASSVSHSVVGASYYAPVTINWGGFTGNQIQSVTATSGLPAGITFSGACSEGCSFAFAGTASVAGTYNVTLTLTLADSSVITTTVTIVVDAAEVTPPVEQPAAISKDIAFAGDSSLLTASAKASLRKLVGYAKAHKIKNVSVTGYTLKTTAAKQSFRSNLGMARANAIAKYLKSLNGKLRVTVIGKGLVNKGRIASVKLQG